MKARLKNLNSAEAKANGATGTRSHTNHTENVALNLGKRKQTSIGKENPWTRFALAMPYHGRSYTAFCGT